MAGNYPDVPGLRMAYDRDGSVGFYINPSNVITQLSTTNLQNLNDESDSTTYSAGEPFSGSTHRFGIIFPELRDLVGYYISAGANNVFAMESSADTTNGFDGAWTTAVNPFIEVSTTHPGDRSSIQTLSLTSKKAIRVTWTSPQNTATWKAWHLYGTISTGQSPDRLRIWHPTNDAEVTGAFFDFSEVARGTNQTKQFRVKNNSSTLTANSIALTLEARTDANPTLIGQFQLSTDNSTFASSINIGNLAPGAISSVLYIKDTAASNAALSLWDVRVNTVATSWT